MKNWKFMVCGLFVILGLANCSYDDYLVDGGKHDPYYNGTVWDYLNSRPDYFTQLVEIIKISDMVDVFKDSTITFFAPPDGSINKTLNLVNRTLYISGKDSVTSLSQIKPEVWKEFLTLYLIRQKYVLKDIPQIDTTAMSAYPGQAYVSYNGKPMNIGVVYHDVNGVKYAGYRQLLYSYVIDITDKDLINAYVASSDIQPVNGAVHVIRYHDHAFGFSANDFYTKAVAAGIGKIPGKKEESEID